MAMPLPPESAEAIAAVLELRVWRAEYVTEYEMEIEFPEPDSGNAMRFSGFWPWLMVDGQLAYGVSDDSGDPWRTRLNLPADASPDGVAGAASRAMYLLLHCDSLDALNEMCEKNMLLSAMERRIQELGRRLVVTQGMIRHALQPSRAWAP